MQLPGQGGGCEVHAGIVKTPPVRVKTQATGALMHISGSKLAGLSVTQFASILIAISVYSTSARGLFCFKPSHGTGTIAP